jgi:membrane-associated phospholipid phosphatase
VSHLLYAPPSIHGYRDTNAVDDVTMESSAGGLMAEVSGLDRAIYAAVAQAETPALDEFFRRLSRVSDKSVLWLGTAAVLATVGGRRGRRAALFGVASIGLASLSVNQGFKRIANRRRPDRGGVGVPDGRHVPMPGSTSFPSGHSASAFAFAEGVSTAAPALGVPVRLVAVAVAYSRVHTGVHYPGDVVAGSLIGITAGEVASRAVRVVLDRRAAAGESAR